MARAAFVSFKIAETEHGARPTFAATVFRLTVLFSGNIARLPKKCAMHLPQIIVGRYSLYQRPGLMSGILSRGTTNGGSRRYLRRCRTGRHHCEASSLLSPTQKFHGK